MLGPHAIASSPSAKRNRPPRDGRVMENAPSSRPWTSRPRLHRHRRLTQRRPRGRTRRCRGRSCACTRPDQESSTAHTQSLDRQRLTATSLTAESTGQTPASRHWRTCCVVAHGAVSPRLLLRTFQDRSGSSDRTGRTSQHSSGFVNPEARGYFPSSSSAALMRGQRLGMGETPGTAPIRPRQSSAPRAHMAGFGILRERIGNRSCSALAGLP